MDKTNLAFGRKNFILLGIGLAIVVIGFLLMLGPGSSESAFEPDIFSFRRIELAPTVTLFGFVFIIFAIMAKPKNPSDSGENAPQA